MLAFRSCLRKCVDVLVVVVANVLFTLWTESPLRDVDEGQPSSLVDVLVRCINMAVGS